MHVKLVIIYLFYSLIQHSFIEIFDVQIGAFPIICPDFMQEAKVPFKK